MALNIASWLQSGAIMYLDDDQYMLSYDLTQRGLNPLESPCYFVPDFYRSDKKPWAKFKHNQVLSRQDLIKALEQHQQNNLEFRSVQTIEMQTPSFRDYEHNFRAIKNLILSGGIKKLVPVVFESCSHKLTDTEKVIYVLSLLTQTRNQHIYGLWDKGQGVLGVSPEILFELSDGVIQTMALAGTGKVEDLKDSLINDAKEMHEHNLVIQNLSETLSSRGEESRSATYEWMLNPLKHLRTDIKIKSIDIKFNSASIMSLIDALHPTAALGVYPKTYNWKNIKQFETMDRAQYGAPFGLLLNDKFKSIVAIRNIQWSKDAIMIGSGSGVVKQSDVKKEWQELIIKRKSVKKYMGMHYEK